MMGTVLHRDDGVMRFGWIGHTAKLTADQGFDVRRPMFDAGVRAGDDLLGDDSPVDPAAFLLMCALIINAVDDEMHGAARTRMVRGSANLAVSAMASAATLQDAIETTVRFFGIAGAYCRLELSTSGPEAAIFVRSESGDPLAQQVVEELFATFLHIQLSHMLGFLLPVSRFGTTARRHPLIARTHPYLRCPVVRANTTTITFPAMYLSFPSRTRVGKNPLLEGELAWIARHEEARTGAFSGGQGDTLSGEVYRTLLREDLSFEACSAALGRDAAAVRRGLWREGARFRDLRRSALVERARPYLHGGASIDDLADALGYSDGRSCRRALRAATGRGVAELREMADVGAGGAPVAVLDRLRTEKQRQG